MRYERSGSTVCPLNTPSKLPSSSCGNHDGQYTGALILFASRCQPAREDFGQAAAELDGRGVGSASPAPGDENERADDTQRPATMSTLPHVRSPLRATLHHRLAGPGAGAGEPQSSTSLERQTLRRR